MSKSRSYLPIWEAIKHLGECRVACSAESQARLIKAVIKEKYMDKDSSDMGKLQIMLDSKEFPGTVLFKLNRKIRAIDLMLDS